MNESREKRYGFVRLALAVLGALALITLYLYFLFKIAGTPVFGPWSPIETVIFYTMLLRVLGLMFVPFLRRLYAPGKIIILFFEDFVLFFLILVIAFTGDQVYGGLLAVLLTSWIGATLLILTPYSIFELVRMMNKGTSLTALVTSGAPLLAVGMFMASLSGSTTFQSGLSGLGITIINSIKDQPGLAGGAQLGSNSLITGSAIVFSVSITLYIAISMNQSIAKIAGVPKYHYALALVLVGIVAAYLWAISTFTLFSGDILEIFSVPAALIPIILWAMSRG
jgi:hypothetical protein